MLNELPLNLIKFLTVTVLFETLTAAALGMRQKSDLANVVLVNVLTNPIVVLGCFLVNFFFGSGTPYIIAVVCFELFALVAEWLIYRKTLDFKKLDPFILSLLLNAGSYGLGVIINKIIMS